MGSDLVQKAKDNARQNFRDGINCAESVFKAVIDTGITGLEYEAVALSTGFGGGIGLAGYNCGNNRSGDGCWGGAWTEKPA